jgi:hypothetical protein
MVVNFGGQFTQKHLARIPAAVFHRRHSAGKGQSNGY